MSILGGSGLGSSVLGSSDLGSSVLGSSDLQVGGVCLSAMSPTPPANPRGSAAPILSRDREGAVIQSS
jgi:hypothetical protein